MSKTISWPARVTYIFIALALALSLVLVAIPAKTDADPGLTKFTKVSTPQIDYSDWEIAQDSTINSFDMGPDGETIYAVGTKWYDATATGTVGKIDADEIRPCLWKSTDHGATWSDKTAAIQKTWSAGAYTVKKAEGLENIFTSFDLVSVAPEDADFVAVAGYADTTPMVVFSDDGGAKFYCLTNLEDEATDIYCMDVSTESDDVHYVAVGATNGTFEGRVLMNKVPGYTSWLDTSVSTYPGWLEMAGGTTDRGVVTSVAFSPIFDTDETILAISSNSTCTWLQSGRWGTTKKWNSEAGTPFPDPVMLVSADPVDYTNYHFSCSGIAIPSDYDGFTTSLRKVFVYVDTEGGKGYLQRIDSSKIYPCPGRDYGFDPDGKGGDLFASIAYHGAGIDGKFMLGEQPTSATTPCCTGVQVWRAEDIDFCCPEWNTASKKPSGQLRALVAFTPDGKKGYATTQGDGLCDESAFSVSLDGNGQYWNQLSLIDTDIDYLSDVAVNGDCNTTLLFTVNTITGNIETQLCQCDSVWFKAEDLPEATEYNDVWLREWHGLLTDDETLNSAATPQIGLIRLAPEEEERVFTVYLVDRGQNTVLYNASSGLTKWLDKHCTKIDAIYDLAAASESIIYALGDGDLVSKSTNNGKKWATEVDTKVTKAHTIAALGDNVLVGPADGGNRKVAYSSDSAATFDRTDALSSSTATGNVHVAFDTYFDVNDTIYAAVDGYGIYRWVIDVSDDWKDLAAEPTEKQLGIPSASWTLTTGATEVPVSYYGIVTELSQDGNPLTDAEHGGVLYAAYCYRDNSNIYTGVARCLTPAQTACCTTENWDYLHAKLTVGTALLDSQQFSLEPSSLKLCGCLTEATNTKLWAIDNQAYDYADGIGRLWTYEDCFAKAGVTLSSVSDGDMVAADPCECYNEKFVLEWERLCNACEYEFDISLNSAFSQIVKDEQDYDPTANGYYDPPSNAAPSIVIDEGDLDCNTTYYWRVRAHYAETGEEIQSWWSDGWSFTVEAGPSVAIDLTAPDDGATKVAITAIGFTWSTVADATSYDFVLSANADLSSPVETKTGLTDTAYTYTGTLSYDTTYFWRVTAMKDGIVFSQSNISTFTTAPAAVFTCPQCGLTFPSEAALETHIAEAHPPVVPTTPAWVWVVIGLGAVLVITIIVLIFRTRRV